MTRIWMSRRSAAGLAFLVIVAGGSAINAALAQSGPYIKPAAKGLTFVFKTETISKGKVTTGGFSHTILDAKGEEVLYRTNSDDVANGDRVHLFRGIFSYAFFRGDQLWVEYKFDRAALRSLWPLAVGKKATTTVQFGFGRGKTIEAAKAAWKATETGHITYEVLRRVMVKTPRGLRQAYVILRERVMVAADNKRKIVQRRTGWFVPELGYIARQTTDTYRPDQPDRSVLLQLVAIK